MNIEDLPGFIDYKDKITNKDLDILRIKVEIMKENAIDMEKQMLIRKDMKEKGQLQFEKKINSGKLTFNDKGKVLNIRQIKTEKLPIEFKQLISHSVVESATSNKRKLKVKQKQKKQKVKEYVKFNGNFLIYRI